jgi:uncharacterized membrane protein YdbT with pleckstrin-like domain
MKCISCAAEVPEGGHFCPACGARQGLAPPAAAPPQEPETPVWEGRYSFRNDGLAWLLWGIFAAFAIFAAVKWLTLSESWQRWTYAGVIVLPAVALLVVSWYRQLSIKYRLTSHRLFKEVGIFSRTISEIELLRVDDLTVTQNLLQRIFDVGVITLTTTDSSDPALAIAGIRSPVQVKEQIRAHVQKRRGRTLNREAL